FFMLIEDDGTITPMWFYHYSTKNTGEYSTWNFDPREYLGKTITMDFSGTPEKNNNEYPIYDASNNLVLLPKVSVKFVNSITEVSQTISVPDDYIHPQTDTLMIPHDVLVAPASYDDQTPTAEVNLSDYVSGSGTEDDPYISADGAAGLKQAVAALPNGGTINVGSGIYLTTVANVNIARFVSIKGTEEQQPEFRLTKNRSWFLKGSNTLDNIRVSSETIESYYNELITIDNNARDVVVKNSTFVGGYAVTPETYEEKGNGVCFRLRSHVQNLLFEDNRFINMMRGIVTKGQRNQHDITIRKNYFEGANHWFISFDQTSNISNIIVEENEFMEFSHFGVAFARIANVVLRNNTFFSRNKLNYNTFSRAIHLEEHCQNFLIENNDVDALLRHPDSDNPNTVKRNGGIAVSDSRYITIKDNTVLNSDVLLGGLYSDIDKEITLTGNKIENGGLHIRDALDQVTFHKNTMVSPPEAAFTFLSNKPRLYPFGGHVLENNTVTEMKNAKAFDLNAPIMNSSIKNNLFQGCSQQQSEIDFLEGAGQLVIEDNEFLGITSEKAFDVKNTPAGNSLSDYQSQNSFTSECEETDDPDDSSDDETDEPDPLTTGFLENEENESFAYPNPIERGKLLKIKNRDQPEAFSVSIFNLMGELLFKQRETIGTEVFVDTERFSSGIYFIKISDDHTEKNVKLILQ
ncbi:MAG: right-handed parallel beta-helix repeat-containing protein, partial [Bacteroidota bacterium]